MSEYTSAFPERANVSQGEGLRHDAPATSPIRPLSGSGLDALVQRQSREVGFAGFLSFVPTQER
ncbi:hypothetical protein [Pengzhenrongella sicca]|uniref:Uncharacterized protein n=1 Tax=Pengzhenrongella sicca TaxID=2819238 RepID=A0A8A4Z8U6_9MICO|nr:hypothetical protein [Pengzhenrongella sicca]QTE28350.1 hypothetical protein J4E96_13295 [Pengzhenrongella sicca]